MLKWINIIRTKVAKLALDPKRNCHISIKTIRLVNFSHVTKTRANLTTYSRKLENYNGTIIFEIDITNFSVVSFVLIYSNTLRS